MRSNRSLSVLGLSLSVASCAAAPTLPSDGPTPAVEHSIALSPAPSEVAKLAIEERIVAEPKGAQNAAERVISEASRDLAACFRGSVDRDPSLVGSIVYELQLGPRGRSTGAVTKSGDLADLPSAACAAGVLAGLSIPAASHDVSVRYTVRLTGQHRPAPLPPAESFPLGIWTVDWTDPQGRAPDGIPRAVLGESESFRRCFVGVAPHREGAAWVVMRVGSDGARLLDESGDRTDEADLCVRRKLASLSFGDMRRPVALTALFGAPGPDKPAALATEKPVLDERGNMWGDEIGDSFGAGGLGLTGIGEGGGGRGEGIGIGGTGTRGRGAGTGTGQGFGSGKGGLGGAHRAKPPKVRMGDVTVGPRLPPEVIQRIVRQNFGRFRLCYENGLRKEPDLEGRVEVTFVIGLEGNVTSVSGGGTMPDNNVIKCVTRAFTSLTFPKPDRGVVTVKYPILFTPDDGPEGTSSGAKQKPPSPAAIDGKPLDQVEIGAVLRRLQARGYEARFVPTRPEEPPPPMLFFKADDREVGHVRLVKGQAPTGVDAACVRTHGGVSLIVGAAPGRCQAVIASLFD